MYRDTSSAFEEHCTSHKHSINTVGKVNIPDSQVAVLHQEPDWFRRGVAEAIHIMREDPTLNRDKGRHTLPVIYRELIHRDHSGHGAQAHQHSNQFTRRSYRERCENSWQQLTDVCKQFNYFLIILHVLCMHDQLQNRFRVGCTSITACTQIT